MTHYFNTIRIPKSDYFRLPPTMRKQCDGCFVLSKINGVETFVRAELIE